MMDYLIQLLTELSEWKIRAFRHTGTFSAMKIASDLVTVSVKLDLTVQKTTLQYKNESEKCKEEQSMDLMETLSNRKDELDEHQREIETLLNRIFRDVFRVRYRDASEDIRCVCIEEMAKWILTSPKGKYVNAIPS